MPFETLETPMEVTSLPEGVENSLTVTPDIPNVDRFGGSLRTDPENDQLIYTNADGEEESISIRGVFGDIFGEDATIGFRLAPTGQPAVFGEDLNSFLVPLLDARLPSDENYGIATANEGLLLVEVDNDGEVTLSGLNTEVEGILFGTEVFDVYPLEDGRVGYVVGEPGGNNTAAFGVFEEGRVDAAVYKSGNTAGIENPGVFASLPNGGTVLFLDDPDSTPPGRLEAIQYDSNDEEIASGYIDDFAQSTPGASVAGVDITANGDLEVYYEAAGEDGADPTFFRTTYDLLPENDPNAMIPTDGDDLLTLTDDDDAIDALGGNDTVFGRGGADEIDGGAGNDDLRGGADTDTTTGGAGDDVLRGNHGDDTMFGDDGTDDMNGGFGNDVVFGGADDDKVSGFDGADTLYGDAGNDRMHGGRGDDVMFGGDSDDVMRGADGADILTGGAGDDLLIGGDGADVYAFDLSANNGADQIKDFTSGEDKIALTAAEGQDLSFDDIFLSQEESFAIIQADETTIRLKGVDAEDLSEDDFLF